MEDQSEGLTAHRLSLQAIHSPTGRQLDPPRCGRTAMLRGRHQPGAPHGWGGWGCRAVHYGAGVTSAVNVAPAPGALGGVGRLRGLVRVGGMAGRPCGGRGFVVRSTEDRGPSTSRRWTAGRRRLPHPTGACPGRDGGGGETLQLCEECTVQFHALLLIPPPHTPSRVQHVQEAFHCPTFCRRHLCLALLAG